MNSRGRSSVVAIKSALCALSLGAFLVIPNVALAQSLAVSAAGTDVAGRADAPSSASSTSAPSGYVSITTDEFLARGDDPTFHFDWNAFAAANPAWHPPQAWPSAPTATIPQAEWNPASHLPDTFWSTPYVPGQDIADTADQVGNEYQERDVDYAMKRPLPNNCADCTSFVADALTRAGVEVGPTATWQFETSPEYEAVSSDDAMPGDVILRPGPNGGHGHAGIFTGDSDRGLPEAWQMGESGARQVEFTGDVEFYRALQTPDYEQSIGEMLKETLPNNQLGEQSPAAASAIYDAIDDAGE